MTRKKTKAIKDRILKDIKKLFEYEEETYYKQVTVNNFRSNNYVEYKSKGNRRMVNNIVRSKYIFVKNNKIEILFSNYIFGLTFQSPSSK